MNLSRRMFTRSGIASLMLTGTGMSIAGCRRNQTGDVLRKLSMQSAWINDAEFMGYFIALDNGYYEDQRLDLEYLPGGPEVVADSVVISGRSDLALTTPDSTISAITNRGADLKIIGAQYQKNPIGVVSLSENQIREPKDLVGKRLAVPPANVITVEAMFKLNDINPAEVEIVPYQYDPGPLLRGEVDATIDFVTNVPFTIREQGGEPTSFLLYDYGFRIFNDTVAVRSETLDKRRDELIAWLRASRKGWAENFENLGTYEPKFENTWFKGTGRSVENEIFFNQSQEDLMTSPDGYFAMSEQSIEECISSLNEIGIVADRSMFVTDLLAEL